MKPIKRIYELTPKQVEVVRTALDLALDDGGEGCLELQHGEQNVRETFNAFGMPYTSPRFIRWRDSRSTWSAGVWRYHESVQIYVNHDTGEFHVSGTGIVAESLKEAEALWWSGFGNEICE